MLKQYFDPACLSFKRFFGFSSFVIFSLSASLTAFSEDATLTWSANDESDLGGYYFYYLNRSDDFSLSIDNFTEKIDIGNTTTFTKTGLGPGTHAFALSAYDTSRNESGLSAVVSKTVLASSPGGVSTNPIISNLRTTNIDSTGVEVRWNTDRMTTTRIEYGLTSTYQFSTGSEASLVLIHIWHLKNLSPSTEYHFRVIATDAEGNSAVSEDRVFTTTSSPPEGNQLGPFISNITADRITTHSATITWNTDRPATSQLSYWPRHSSRLAGSTTRNDVLESYHQQILTDLLPNTEYDYEIISVDAGANEARETRSFQTLSAPPFPDTEPPGDVIRFMAVGGDQEARLSWIDPPDKDYKGVIIRFRTDGPPRNLNDGFLLGEFNPAPNGRMLITHGGLSNGLTYYYLAVSFDHNGNFQTTAFAQASPSSTVSSSKTSASGGCGTIIQKNGKPPGPGDAAALLTLIGLLFLLFLKKVCKLKDVQASRLPV